MLSSSLKTTAIITLLQVEKGEHFLPSFVDRAQSQNPSLNLSLLARYFGYQSRGHFREMVIGQKSISLKAAERMGEKLGFSRDEKKLLELKIIRDHAPSQMIDRNIQDLTRKIHENDDDNFIFRNRVDEVVFALISQKEPGISVAQLSSKTGYNRFEVRESITHFEKVGAIRKTAASGYVALDLHKITRNLRSMNFARSYADGIQNLADLHESKRLIPENSLLLHSFFPVALGKFPELKAKLRELLESFVDREQSDGEDVVEIMLGAMDLNLLKKSNTI